MTSNKANCLPRQIDAKEAGRDIRAKLRKAFPGTKFSVRKNSNETIRIDWTNGPTMEQVERIAMPHQGRTFDGMTDSNGFNRDPVTLESGEAVTPAWSFVICQRDIYTACEDLARILTADDPEMSQDDAMCAARRELCGLTGDEIARRIADAGRCSNDAAEEWHMGFGLA